MSKPIQVSVVTNVRIRSDIKLGSLVFCFILFYSPKNGTLAVITSTIIFPDSD